MSGGVIDGQPVDQTITNAAFLFKNANDTSTGIYTLNAPSSGPQLNNIQQAINVVIEGVGGSQSVPATGYTSIPSGTIPAGVNHLSALISLAQKYFGAASAGGHTHTGVDGQGPIVSAVGSIGASGSPFSPLTGAVLLAASGDVVLTQAGQTITIFSQVDGGEVTSVAVSGQSPIINDVTFSSSGGIVLTQSGQNIQIFSSAASASVNSLAASGFSGLTGNIILAPSGEVQISQSGQTITVFAPSGLSSIAASGQTALTGAVTLSVSGGLGILQSGQDINISGIVPTVAIAASTIDWSLGNMFSKTLASSTTFGFSNKSDGQTIVVIVNNPSTYSITWPTVKWSNGTVPAIAASAIDVYTFLFAASTVYGSAVQSMS